MKFRIFFIILYASTTFAQTTKVFNLIKDNECLITSHNRIINHQFYINKNNRETYYSLDLSIYNKSLIYFIENSINFKISSLTEDSNKFEINIINKTGKPTNYIPKTTIHLNEQIITNLTCLTKDSTFYNLNLIIKLHKLNDYLFSISIYPCIYFQVNLDNNIIFKISYDPVFNEILFTKLGDTLNYYLNEPFHMDSSVFCFTNINLKLNTVECIKNNISNKLIGYKEGYYLNSDLLNKLKKLTTNNPNYYILYFWGPWCSPCVKAHDSMIIFSNKINNKKSGLNLISIKISMIKNKKEYSLENYNKNLIFEKEIIEPISKNLTNKQISYSKALNIFFYPSLVIVDKTGKIIKTGIKDIKEFNDFASINLN
ncbi:MAG: hypothetical protein IPG55_11585 [Saprospiraceae bacterium]|nr:hypothetical protein [Candidatus Defluviibacterium haderslevense]